MRKIRLPILAAGVGLCSCSILNSVMTMTQWKAAFDPSRFVDFTLNGQVTSSGEELASFALLADGEQASWDVSYPDGDFHCNLSIEEGALFSSLAATVDLRPLLGLFADSFSDYGYYFGSYLATLAKSWAERACDAVEGLGGIVEFVALPSSVESEVLFDGALRVSKIDLKFDGATYNHHSATGASAPLELSLSFTSYGSTALQ